MTCLPSPRATRRWTLAAVVTATTTAAALTSTSRPARAQTPTPPTPPVPTPELPAGSASPPIIAAYRAPVLALVQPPPAAALGGVLTVPQDRPVVVFRFAQGEPDDPIDAASFRVAVDGRDRTAQFQVTASPAAGGTAVVGGATGETWGSLGDASAPGTAPFALGTHQVAARVCSSRGACATVDVAVTAVPATVAAAAPGGTSSASAKAAGRGRRVIDFVLNATKRLLAP